jgi:hypothetical protein
VLWPTYDPERQWTPDTLDRIADIVASHKPAMVNKPERLSDAEIRALYGRRAVISRKGLFTLVHLDNPSTAIVRQRRREFDPAKFFCADCPLCSVLKESGVIVFDDSMFDAEETSPEKEKHQ